MSNFEFANELAARMSKLIDRDERFEPVLRCFIERAGEEVPMALVQEHPSLPFWVDDDQAELRFLGLLNALIGGRDAEGVTYRIGGMTTDRGDILGFGVRWFS